MNSKRIFLKLISIAKKSKDPKGIVSACLVRDGKIFDYAVSSDNGVDHAEKILLSKYKNNSLGEFVLYVTLEPCSRRSDPNNKSCSDYINVKGIKKVVFGALDIQQHSSTLKKMKENNIKIKQIEDQEIIQECQELFNSSIVDNDNYKFFNL